MSQNKFTPGPWSVPHFADENPTCGCQYVFSESQSGFGSIAMIQFGGEDEPYEQAKANARLISAAPELYEALTAVLKYTKIKGIVLGTDPHAAIAKARGDHEQA